MCLRFVSCRADNRYYLLDTDICRAYQNLSMLVDKRCLLSITHRAISLLNMQKTLQNSLWIWVSVRYRPIRKLWKLYDSASEFQILNFRRSTPGLFSFLEKRALLSWKFEMPKISLQTLFPAFREPPLNQLSLFFSDREKFRHWKVSSPQLRYNSVIAGLILLDLNLFSKEH